MNKQVDKKTNTKNAGQESNILVQSFISNGQKIELNGDLSFLKEVKSVQLVFDYSGMSVGKFENGEEYVALKKKEYNEKEPGNLEKHSLSIILSSTKKLPLGIWLTCPDTAMLK